jgi:hypothetical protein
VSGPLGRPLAGARWGAVALALMWAASSARADLPSALPPGDLLTNSSFDQGTTAPWRPLGATLAIVSGFPAGCGSGSAPPCAPTSSAAEVADAGGSDPSGEYGIASGTPVTAHAGYAYTASAWVAGSGASDCTKPPVSRQCGTNGLPIQIELRELDAFGSPVSFTQSAVYTLPAGFYRFITATLVAQYTGDEIVAEVVRRPAAALGVAAGIDPVGANRGGPEAFLVDQFSLIGAAPAYVPPPYSPTNPDGNLTSNPAFEDAAAGTTGWAAIHGTLARVPDPSAPTEDAAGQPDAYVARVALDGPAGDQYAITSDQPLAVKPGYTYTATAWVKGDGGAPIVLALDELNAGASAVNGVASRPLTLTGTGYQELSVSYTASADGGDTIRLSVIRPAGSTTTGDAFDVDGLTLTASGPCAAGLGGFGPGRWPAGCWRPYAADAAINTQIPFGAAPLPFSPEIVSNLLNGAVLAGDGSAGGQAPGALTATSQPHPARPDGFVDPLLDGGSHPTFWAQPSDPRYVIDCNAAYGRADQTNDCPAHAATVADPMTMPAGATPAGYFAASTRPGVCTHDAHMTVVDQGRPGRGATEFDLWCVQSITPASNGAPGVVRAGWAGVSPLGGDGFGGAATAGNFDLLAGVIRAQELEQGVVNHALFVTVPCAGDVVVAGPTPDMVPPVTPPGIADNYCTGTSSGGTHDPFASLYPDALPMGAHLRLGLTDGQIENLPSAAYPSWQKAIMLALSRYGGYVGDTAGEPGQWGFQTEGGTTYTSFTRGPGGARYIDEMFQFASTVEPAAHDYNNNYCPSLNLNPPADPFTAGSCAAPHSDTDEYYLSLGNIDWTRLQLLPPPGS